MEQREGRDVRVWFPNSKAKFQKKKIFFKEKKVLNKRNNEKWCMEEKNWGTFFFLRIIATFKTDILY